MKPDRIHRGGIFVYWLIFAFATLNLAAPPGNWPLFLIMLAISIVVVMTGRGRRWISWSMVVVAGMFLAVELFAGHHLAREVKAVKLQHEVRTLAVGTPIAEVKAFLDGKGIEYSYDESKRRAYAIIRNAGRGLVISKSIAVDLSFDEAGKLIEVQSAAVYTGP